MRFYNSRYNFTIPVTGGELIYNSKTGGTVLIDNPDVRDFLPYLTGNKIYFEDEDFSQSIVSLFLKNGFLVEEDRDELEEIRETYWKARGETPVAYTIVTTMDCNLGCYYCYENRSKHQLESGDIEIIIAHIEKTFNGNFKRSLHVDWFGGEPLLNIPFIETASLRIQEFCKENGISYHASVVSNGTLWPQDVLGFISRHKIRQIQITFDGIKESHEKVRRYRREYQEGKSSFDEAINLINELANYVKVDLRFNISPLNQHELIPFMDYIEEQGFFNKKYPVTFFPAMVSAYTEKAAFVRKEEFSPEELDGLTEEIRERLKGIGKVAESQNPHDFPFPKNYVCAALANDSHVIGADKSLHRCGLEVGEKHLAVGHFEESNTLMDANKAWWDKFDPCNLPSCSKCSFLPICFGGCAKKHFDRDQQSLDAMSEYWKNNLSRMVSSYLKYSMDGLSHFSERDQFRNGYV
jgi:uncharacterized protein